MNERCCLSFKSLRRKNNLLMEAFKTIEQMKKAFDGYGGRGAF